MPQHTFNHILLRLYDVNIGALKELLINFKTNKMHQ